LEENKISLESSGVDFLFLPIYIRIGLRTLKDGALWAVKCDAKMLGLGCLELGGFGRSMDLNS